MRGASARVATLYVQASGCYAGLPDVDLWPESRDARTYAGPWPVVAHPPCQRWGRYATGGPRYPQSKVLGDDGGCFQAALASVREWGGVIEHPAGSRAWPWHGLRAPPAAGGWVQADGAGGWTCHVEQGHYGHLARKATWLYAVRTVRPELRWGSSADPDPEDCPWRGMSFSRPPKGAPPEWRAERRAWLAWRAERGLKVRASPELMSRSQREATPTEFRDLLLSLARSVGPARPAGQLSLWGGR